MKILHFISSGGMFGAERVLINIAKLSSANFQYVIAALHNTHNPHLEILEVARDAGIPTFEIKSRGAFDLKAVGALRRLLRDEKIDVVHSHNYKSDVIAFAATRFSNVKWVATNHTWHALNQKAAWFEKFDAWVMRWAQALIAVSEATKAQMVKTGLSAQRIKIIDNGIDIERFQGKAEASVKSSLGIGKDDFLVGIVGRLSPEKDHLTFLKAAKLIRQKRSDIKFLIIGDGPLRKDLENFAESLGLAEGVIFTGIRKDMPQIYAAMDVFVISSLIEGLPMCLLEAMAAKKPVITTAVGAITKVIVHQQNGLVFKVGDEQQLQETILLLLEQPSERARLAQQAYEDVVENYSDAAMRKQYEEIYRKVGRSRSSRHFLAHCVLGRKCSGRRR